jgi:hypothetical protein
MIDVIFCVASGTQSGGQSNTQASSRVVMQNQGFNAAEASGSYNPLQQQALGQSTQINYSDQINGSDPENVENSLASYYNVENQQQQYDQQAYSAPPVSAPMQLVNNEKKESFCFLL